MKSVLVMALILSGCNATNAPVSHQQISAFNNDAACNSLMIYTSDGPKVLRLSDGQELKGASLNQERCYTLSQMDINSRDYHIYGDTNNTLHRLRQARDERDQRWKWNQSTWSGTYNGQIDQSLGKIMEQYVRKNTSNRMYIP